MHGYHVIEGVLVILLASALASVTAVLACALGDWRNRHKGTARGDAE